MSRVLATGGSGYLGGHVLLRLLADGHEVRTTVRALDRRQQVREVVAAGGAEHIDRVSLFVADLTSDAG